MAHDVYHLGLSKISVVLDGWWATFDSFIDWWLQQIVFNASTDPQLLSSGIIYDLLYLEGTLIISNNLLHLETWYCYPNRDNYQERRLSMCNDHLWMILFYQMSSPYNLSSMWLVCLKHWLNFLLNQLREGVKKTGKKRSGWPKLFVKILGLFSHWILFLDTQNRFYFIVKRLKNASFMCIFIRSG